jgi:hypothetical protein
MRAALRTGPPLFTEFGSSVDRDEHADGLTLSPGGLEPPSSESRERNERRQGSRPDSTSIVPPMKATGRHHVRPETRLAVCLRHSARKGVFEMIATTAFLITLLCPALPTQAADTPPGIAIGDRVRIWTGERVAATGRISSADSNRFDVRPDGAGPALSIPRTDVTRIDVSRGRASRGKRARQGAVWGALIAAALGAVSLGIQHEQVGPRGSSAGKAAALGAYSGGLFGGLAGAVIGAVRGGERWERVSP